MIESEVWRFMVAAILRGLQQRLARLLSQPAASDATIPAEYHDDGYEATKAKLLANAKLLLFPVSHSPKLSKFTVESSWIQDVLQATLKEVEDAGTFTHLTKKVTENDAREKRLLESSEHAKMLNSEMHMLRQQIRTEAASHKEALVSWSKSLAQLKQGIKELKKQSKLTIKYRADIAAAEADCNRRVRDERLTSLRDEIDHLTRQVESENRVASFCVEFLKKENLQLMEEAIALGTGHENDVQSMGIMLSKLRDQMHEKECLLSDLEPRYKRELDEMERAKSELERKKHLGMEETERTEVQNKAVVHIQRVWRGHRLRLQQCEILKMIEKKRKALRKQKNKKISKKK